MTRVFKGSAKTSKKKTCKNESEVNLPRGVLQWFAISVPQDTLARLLTSAHYRPIYWLINK
jgi:hypothetical protein